MIALKRCCLVLNGDSSFENIEEFRDRIVSSEYDIIIAVDGGANYLYKCDIIPDFLVGDFDSLEEGLLDYYIEKGVKLERHNVKKDETDSELAILLAKRLGVGIIDIYSATGGRIDHEMANLLLLSYVRNHGIDGRIVASDLEVYIVIDEEKKFSFEIGDIMSVIPIKGDAKRVSLIGFEYPLDKFDMEFSTPRGISNVVEDINQTISVEDGSLLVFHYHKK